MVEKSSHSIKAFITNIFQNQHFQGSERPLHLVNIYIYIFCIKYFCKLLIHTHKHLIFEAL